MSIEINHTARSYPKLKYEEVKNAVLGKNYHLSLVFVGEKKGREINKQSRNKTYAPNVLSFPLTNESGEIFITPTVAKKEAHKYDHSYTKHVMFLYIHGLLHLKGYDHGDKMENLEKKYLAKYS